MSQTLTQFLVLMFKLLSLQDLRRHVIRPSEMVPRSTAWFTHALPPSCDVYHTPPIELLLRVGRESKSREGPGCPGGHGTVSWGTRWECRGTRCHSFQSSVTLTARPEAPFSTR